MSLAIKYTLQEMKRITDCITINIVSFTKIAPTLLKYDLDHLHIRVRVSGIGKCAIWF